MFRKSARPSSTGLGLQPVHQVDDIEEPAPGTIADDRTRDRHGDMGLAGPRAANQHDIALLAEELPAGQIPHQRLVDRRIIEGELFNLPGIGQLGGGDLVFDRARLLLVDLGGQKISDDLAGFVVVPDLACGIEY